MHSASRCSPPSPVIATDSRGQHRQDEALSEWFGSIHSRSALRSDIAEFRSAHIQRDELTAEEIVRQAIATNDMWTQPILDKHPIRWFCDAVWYLMFAIMPRRDQTDTTERLRISQHRWSPSTEALRFAQSKSRAPWVIDTSNRRRYGSIETTVAARHVPVAGGSSDLGSRRTLLEKLRGEVTQRELGSRVPRDIVEAFWVALNQAEADARVTGEYDWLPNFNFEMRGWRSNASQSHSGTTPASPATEYNGPAPQQYTDGESPPQALGQAEVPGTAGEPPSGGVPSLTGSPPSGPANPPPGGGSPPGAPGPAGRPPGSPPQPPRSGSRPPSGTKSARRAALEQPWQATYYTVGEVGNHRFRADLWALVDDGRSGFDIYDVTGMFSALAISDFSHLFLF